MCNSAEATGVVELPSDDDANTTRATVRRSSLVRRPGRPRKELPPAKAPTQRPQGAEGGPFRTPLSLFDADAGKDSYEVDYIVARVQKKGADHYVVRWKGLSQKADTTEPVEHLQDDDSQAKIEAWREQQAAAEAEPRPARRRKTASAAGAPADAAANPPGGGSTTDENASEEDVIVVGATRGSGSDGKCTRPRPPLSHLSDNSATRSASRRSCPASHHRFSARTCAAPI